MKRNYTVLAFGVSVMLGTALIYGCGDDDTTSPPTGSSSGTSGVDSGKTDTGTSSSSSSSSSSGDTGTPDSGTKPPTLGAQIDRFGRPAINTAGNSTFEFDAGTAGQAKDKYNADNNKSGWAAAYTSHVASNLAIYDSIDKNCGNQPFADAGVDNQNSAVGRYGFLASVLSDDRQWMNTAGTTKTVGYLAVELNATGVAVNTDVGGRKLSDDVINRTYGVVSGVDPLGAGVSDGVDAVTEKVSGTTFPYLAAP